MILFADEARALSLDFVSHTQQLDASTPLGNAMFTILAALAQLEREMIGERTRVKLQMQRARGVRLGRPRVHIDMDRARRLVNENKITVRALARALGVSSGTASKVRLEVLRAAGGAATPDVAQTS